MPTATATMTHKKSRTTVRDRIVALLTHPRLRALETDDQIGARLLGLGIHEVCSRCGGSGRYSYNPRDLDRCWGCGGSGKRGAKLTKANEARLRAAVEAGELDAYADLLHRRAAAKRALKGSFDRMLAAYSASEWYRYHYKGEGRRDDYSHVHVLSYAWSDFAEEARDGADDLVRKSERGDADPEVALAAVEEALAAVARMDRAHAFALPRYAECRAEEDAAKALPYPARFDAEAAHRTKWKAIAAEIWAAV